jgi:ABC-type transporter MlaC component
MVERDGRWLAEDIVVEGNSLTDLYEFQFDGILANRSFEELLELMRRKTGMFRKQDEL